MKFIEVGLGEPFNYRRQKFIKVSENSGQRADGVIRIVNDDTDVKVARDNFSPNLESLKNKN